MDQPRRHQGQRGDPEVALNWRPWALALVVGLVVGAGGLRLAETLATDAELEARRSELTRLKATLVEDQRALEASQHQVQAQADALKAQTAQALKDVDQVLQTQGSAAERLRQVSATLRRWHQALADVN